MWGHANSFTRLPKASENENVKNRLMEVKSSLMPRSVHNASYHAANKAVPLAYPSLIQNSGTCTALVVVRVGPKPNSIVIYNNSAYFCYCQS